MGKMTKSKVDVANLITRFFGETSFVVEKNSSPTVHSLDCIKKEVCFPSIIYDAQEKVENITDLYVIVHDKETGQTTKMNVIIKSKTCDSSILLISSNLTNFHYRLTKPLSQENVDLVNNMKVQQGSREVIDVMGRLAKIKDLGSELKFCGIQPNKNGENVFLENLILVDSCMPRILAWLLHESFSTGERRIDKLTEMLTKANPMHFPMVANKKIYEAKVKRLLMDFALGMLPGQPWEETNLASGVLVVKPSGNIDCYHILYKDTLEDYLFHDLKFETASASRHDFAFIKTDKEGSQYFTLNLQLRFI